ncbi:MAG: UvrB/UvrC motif-containing protein [Candidatus Adlerbacteria bacterium]|nr:UvrB/UvrC motif-containing protein [Candidatus Adlerbacteria bacterium]
MTLEQFKKVAKKMPDTPGVYFFLGKNKKVLYIGKATSLRDRVRSYFAPDLLVTRGPLITSMLGEARSIDWRQTDSVLEALILEANLIRNYKPKHNTDLKDDKSWNYVVITKEEYPRVLLIRGKNLELEARSLKLAAKYGPFPHGLQLREAMKLIRRIFPYRDKCEPNVGRPCFNAQIGLCPGVCSGKISKQEYRKIIRHISLLFQGKKKTLLVMLKKEMKQAAKQERFEEAARLRSQIFALEHIRDVSLIKDEYRDYRFTKSIDRIEAYDAAHLRGSAAVGVMTVVEDGEAQKQEYRKFRLRQTTSGDDTGAIKEILSRRLGHDEWPMPRIIAVDGGTAQINAAEGVLRTYGVEIPVVGVVKDDKHRPREIRGNRELIAGRERDILLANAEAHRFAIGYHRKKLQRRLPKY